MDIFMHNKIKDVSNCIDKNIVLLQQDVIKMAISDALKDSSGETLIKYLKNASKELLRWVKETKTCNLGCARLFVEAFYYPQIVEIYCKLPEQEDLPDSYVSDLNNMFLMKYTKAMDTLAVRTQRERDLGQTFPMNLPPEDATPIDIYDFSYFGLHVLEPDFLKWAGAHWPVKKRWDRIFRHGGSLSFLKLHPELIEMGITATTEF